MLIVLGLVASVLRLGGGSAPEVGPADVDLTVPAWGPSVAETQLLSQVAEARRREAPDPEADAGARSLIDAYVAFNETAAEVRGDRRSKKLAEAHAQYEQWALSYVKRSGPAAFMGLGQRLADDFVRGLRAKDEATIRRLGGTFKDHLRAAGVLGARLQPTSDAAPWVIQVAFVVHWAQGVHQNRPSDQLVAPEERLLMLRWKLAANPLVPPERREEVARELVRLGSAYPVAAALGARAADEGDWSRAARYYTRAAREAAGDATLEANARFAGTKSGAGRRP